MTARDQEGPVLRIVRENFEPLLITAWFYALLLAGLCGAAIESFAPERELPCECAAERVP